MNLNGISILNKLRVVIQMNKKQMIKKIIESDIFANGSEVIYYAEKGLMSCSWIELRNKMLSHSEEYFPKYEKQRTKEFNKKMG